MLADAAGMPAGQSVRIRRAASWSTPLVAIPLPPAADRAPLRSVKRPPASWTITIGAATSQIDTAGSRAISAAPSATSMYCQKSP